MYKNRRLKMNELINFKFKKIKVNLKNIEQEKNEYKSKN